MYVPLRVHGWHSLLTGVDAPASLLERAGELGFPALALTDVDTLGGTTEFSRAALRQAEDGAGPRPILGAEITDPGDPLGRAGRVVALVAEEEGYRNLCRLVSARQLGGDPGEPRASDDELPGPEGFDLVAAVRRWHAGLVLLVDHPRLVFALAGRVPAERLLVAISPAGLGKRARAASPAGRSGQDGDRGRRRGRARRARITDVAPTPPDEDPRFETPKVPPPMEAVAALELVESARSAGLATVAVPDVYWAWPRGFEHHRLRTAIKHNALRCDLPASWLAERPGHLMAPRELAALFADLPDVPGPFAPAWGDVPGALTRTLVVAERCRWMPELGGVLFPTVALDEGETPYSKLCNLAFEGVRRRFRPLKPEVVRRLDHELSAIDELGFAAYFLLVRQIADFARERGIPYVGRGSAADSLVAYCLELTDADPMRYRLPFERFLNPSRKDRPDIDLDFCWRRRDEVIEYVTHAFGAERTAMIATQNRFGLRAAFREAALAEGIPPVEVNRWSKRLPWLTAAGTTASSSTGTLRAEDGEVLPAPEPPEDGDPETPALRPLEPRWRANAVARALAATPECRDFPLDDPRFEPVLTAAAELIDAPRHLGLHPGGVVVAPGPITDVVSCQWAAKGVVVTQLDKDGVEAVGLVKMDLLGNRALTVIDDCVRTLATWGQTIDPAAIPEDDLGTAHTLVRGLTLGCFQVESPGMRNLLKQTAAKTMDDVIQAVALIRPGPAGSGMKDAYVRRFRGREEPTPPHPRLTELLWDTQGVMLYQEDVMQTVVLMAGMDLAEADRLRRALAKRRGPELEALRARYFEGAREEGIADADARRVWELVENFSSFGFCKAHAVTYGRIAYRTVYLKTHHPAAYLTAFLNSETGYYETRVYVEEARRAGVAILPPDVNKSGAEWSAEPGSPAAIRVGLNRVKGLSERTRRAILDAREREGAFLSLPDVLERTGAHVDEVEHLIQCGAFDAFDRTRPEMLWRLHLLTAPARRPPRAAGDAPLDPGLLAACREGPDERARKNAEASARTAREATGGWSRNGLGVGGLELERGQSASLFPDPETPPVALPPRPETDRGTRGRLELELLGVSVCAHPTLLFPCEAHQRLARAREQGQGRRPPRRIPCGELDDYRGGRVGLEGWLAASRRVRTADGRWMRFLTLEDESGLAEVVVFPAVYERDGHRLAGPVRHGPFLVSGVVEDQLGACTLHAEHIW